MRDIDIFIIGFGLIVVVILQAADFRWTVKRFLELQEKIDRLSKDRQ